MDEPCESCRLLEWRYTALAERGLDSSTAKEQWLLHRRQAHSVVSSDLREGNQE